MVITWPSDTKDIIDQMREAIGRNVDFYYIYSSYPCPSCFLDPVTNTSTNSFCPTCSGVYWIPLYSGEAVLAHITWGGVESLNWVTGGQYHTGDCRVQIEYTDHNDFLAKNAKYLIVDKMEMIIDKKIYRGFKEINRILLDLKERE